MPQALMHLYLTFFYDTVLVLVVTHPLLSLYLHKLRHISTPQYLILPPILLVLQPSFAVDVSNLVGSPFRLGFTTTSALHLLGLRAVDNVVRNPAFVIRLA